MEYLNELISPRQVAALAAAVGLTLLAIVGWMVRGWKSHVDDELKGQASKGDVEAAKAELRATLERLAKEAEVLHDRFFTAAQRAAGAFRDIASLREGLERFGGELDKVRERLHRLESQRSAIVGLEASVERLEGQLGDLRRELERGEPP